MIIIMMMMSTQDVLVEGTREVDVDQLTVVQRQAQHLPRELEVVQVVGVHRRVAVGLERGTWRTHARTRTHL